MQPSIEELASELFVAAAGYFRLIVVVIAVVVVCN